MRKFYSISAKDRSYHLNLARIAKDVRTAFLGCVLTLSLLIIIGCGGGGATEPTTGSLAFKATWPAATEPASTARATTEADQDVCTTYAIETVTAVVLDSAGTLRGSGEWPCDAEDHRGTIEAIPTGSDYSVVVEGIVADIVRWRGEATGITIEANKTTVVDRIIMASLDHLLTASASAGGQITPAGQIAFASGSEQTFQFTSDSGYEIADVIVDGSSVGNLESYTFTNINADHTIYVSFVPSGAATTHTITASAGEGGEIVPSGDIGVVSGNDQTFIFVPANDNTITDVIVDGESHGAITSYTFSSVSADHTIRVAFNTITYTITASAGAGGSIDPSGEQTVKHGDSPSFAITADPGFYLSSILINGSAVAPQIPYVIGNVTADNNIHAEFAAVVFVDADASGGGDGRSWANAFKTLQEAINNAPADADIWVRGGTYALSNQVSVNRVVQIYGGFLGDEHLLAHRDVAANPTRIDGGQAARCLFINADATLDGLWVQNGRHIADFNGQGGGVYIDNAAPRLINCIFENNASTINSGGASGGAIYINGGSPVIDGCRFENNFTANAPQPSQGGAIFNNDGFPTITDTVFIGNRAPGDESNAGAIYNNGGGATIARCRFADNYAGMSSGGSGGAIFNDGGMHAISDSIFQGNLAEGIIWGRGGAICNWSCVLTLTNSIFTDNEARHGQSGRGGAIYNDNSDPSITNCTFFANRAVGTSEAYAIGAAILNMDSRPQIVNSIFWGNLADQLAAVFEEGTSLSQITYCNMDHYPGPVEGTGNISEDPLLDAQGHLRPGSPCIDKGDDASAPDTDIDGEPRPQGDQSDIGADEFVDGDGDAMPDYWEVMHGLNTGTDDSGGDLDGDRVPNGFEYRFDLNPSRANPVLNAANRGFYQESGDHDQSNDSTPAGRLAGPAHRSYFIFPLDSVADLVVAAVLRLEVVNYQSTLTSDDLEVFDVSTDPATLEQSGTDQTDIFDDLGSGTRYSILPVGPGDVGQILDIALPASALDDINARLGGSFSVGLALNFFGVASTEFVTFSTGSEDRVHQLILSTE